MKKSFFVLIVLALVLASCGKYDEGPAISFRSKTARLSNTWEPVKVLFNNVDATEPNTTNYKFFFDEEGDFQYIKETVTYEGSWKFSSKKEDIYLEWERPYLTITVTELDTFSILMLKNSELWLKNDSCELHFEGME